MLARWIDRSVDHVRLPSPLDPTPPSPKTGCTSIFLTTPPGTVGLINASMHGDPFYATAIAVGCALFHHPRCRLVWGSRRPGRRARPTSTWPGSAWARSASCSQMTGRRRFGRPARDRGLLERPTPLERAIIVEDRLPFGSGWISWRAVPRLAVDGRLELLGHDHHLLRFSAYHDHNWGRWRWGDDAGWEWGAFLAEPPGPAFVWSRPTNRAHTTGASLLTVHAAGPRTTLFRTGLPDRTLRPVDR